MTSTDPKLVQKEPQGATGGRAASFALPAPLQSRQRSPSQRPSRSVARKPAGRGKTKADKEKGNN